MNARHAAVVVITEVLQQRASLSSLLHDHLKNITPRDHGFFQELCYGTLRWYPKISATLDHLLDKPFKAKDHDLQALLAISIYQLAFTRVPPHAAINEAVSVTRQIKKQWASGLVNAVLRNYQRKQSEIESSLANDQCYQTAHPSWLLDLLKAAWPGQWQQIITANNQRGPMTLRVNASLQTRDEYLQKLMEEGIEAEPTRFSSTGITLESAMDVSQLPGFNEGMVSVQDEAAQLAVEFLAPKPNERALDACCAPGGKLCHILETTGFQGEVWGVEKDGDRLLKIEENLQRIKARDHTSLQLKILTADAANPSAWWDTKQFHRILVDAPCSATGVIRRHPDIKLLRKPTDIAPLAALQHQILCTLWPLLEPGGVMLYTTCSILPDENDKVIEAFVRESRDVQVKKISLDCGLQTHFGRQLFPQVGGHDGFYYSLLGKIPVT